MKREHRVALGLELLSLSLVVAWAAQLLRSHESVTADTDATKSLSSLLGALTLLLLAAGTSALLSHTRLPEQLRSAFRSAVVVSLLYSLYTIELSVGSLAVVNGILPCDRPERDTGLVIGCVLVPIVLLSRLLAQLYLEDSLSGASV